MKHGWEYKKLGEVSEIVGGSTPKTNIPSYWDGEYSWITPAELNGSKYIGSTERHITNEALAHTNLQLLPVGTVLLTSRAPIGKVAITKIPMYCNQGFKNIVPGDSLFNEFAYWYLTYKKDYIISLGRGATFKEISKSITEQIPIPVPPFEEQKAICSLLDKMNRVIEAKKEQLKELDNLAQAIFYDMFGDPVTNEKGWEIQTMGGFGSFQRGLLLQKKDFVEKGHPCIHYGQLHTSFGSYTTKHLTCISEELFSKSKIAHTGDLVLALTSEDIEGSCKSTAWLGDFDIAVGSDAAIFSHNQNAIYLSFYTRTKAFYNEKEKYARGFKVTHIKTTDIAKIPICLPPISLQQAFAEKVEAIERQKELINQSLREVQTLFDSRMDYWFSEEDDDFGQLDKLD